MADGRLHRRSVGILRLKRTYDSVTCAEARRLLVERLWPRGIRKSALETTAWLREVAPGRWRVPARTASAATRASPATNTAERTSPTFVALVEPFFLRRA